MSTEIARNEVHNFAGPALDIVRPLASGKDVAANFQAFQALKADLLTPGDFQAVGSKSYVVKSGWRKIGTAFGVSDEVMREARIEREDAQGRPYFVVEVVARAIAPNGRYSDAVGSCASNERGYAHVEHDVRATAHTRAKTRAISDLVGGGEVSYEEMSSTPPEDPTEAAFWTSLNSLGIKRGNRAHLARIIDVVSEAVKAAQQPKPDAVATAVEVLQDDLAPGIRVIDEGEPV